MSDDERGEPRKLDSRRPKDRDSIIAWLEEAKRTLERDNPDALFVVDEDTLTVFLRRPENGMDYGIYAWALTGDMVMVYENGHTMVARPIPPEGPIPPEEGDDGPCDPPS